VASAATVDADGLCALLAAARAGSNRLLDALAIEQRGQTLQAQDPPFLAAPIPGRPQTAIAAADFHRPYALTLAALELTLHGYCALRKFGWQRRTEAVFSLGRPPFWRRLLHPPPLLALRLSVQGGAAAAAVGIGLASADAGAASSRDQDIRLAPALQETLLQLHRAHRAPPWYRRLPAR
jgi:hypothetical protein